MANFGGFLQALGQAFGGYGQDQQTRFARNQALQRLGLEQRSADDAHVNALLERATNYPFAANAGNVTVGPDGLPTGSVDVPGYGTIDPFGRLRLGLMSKRAESRITTDEKIRESQETGTTDKNKAETVKAQAEASPDFAGQKAGAEEAARFPWQQKLEGARYGYQNQLQNNRFGFEQGQQGRQQAFEQGQQGRQFQFDAEKAARQLEGGYLNESALTNQRARGTLTGKFLAPGAGTTAPSNAAFLPKLTGEQVIRAARDPQYKQFLEFQGYTLGGTP